MRTQRERDREREGGGRARNRMLEILRRDMCAPISRQPIAGSAPAPAAIPEIQKYDKIIRWPVLDRWSKAGGPPDFE